MDRFWGRRARKNDAALKAIYVEAPSELQSRNHTDHLYESHPRHQVSEISSWDWTDEVHQSRGQPRTGHQLSEMAAWDWAEEVRRPQSGGAEVQSIHEALAAPANVLISLPQPRTAEARYLPRENTFIELWPHPVSRQRPIIISKNGGAVLI
jgi:hypothetical protein